MFTPMGGRVFLSRDGKKAAATNAMNNNFTVRLWEVPTSKPLGPAIKHEAGVCAVSFSPDGTRVLTVAQWSSQAKARLWDTATRKPLGQAMVHNGGVSAVAFSPDGKKIVMAGPVWGKPPESRIWDATTCSPLGQPMAHDGGVNAVVFSPDGAKIATLGVDIRLWDADSCQRLNLPLKLGRAARSVTFSADGSKLGIAFEDGSAELWNLAMIQQGGSLLLQDGSQSGAASLRNSRPGTNRLPLEPPAGQWLHSRSAITDFAFRPDGKMVATVGEDRKLRLWDVTTRKLSGTARSRNEIVEAMSFSPDGTKLATARTDGTVRLRDPTSGEPFGVPMKNNGRVDALVFSPDSTKLLTVSGREVGLWNVTSGGLLGSDADSDQDSEVTATVFSSDGKLIATADEQGLVRLRDAATFQVLGAPMKHEHAVNAMAFSADSARIATISGNMALLWETAKCQSLGSPMKHDGAVWAIAFSPDDTKIATASADGTARLWDVTTCQPLGPPMTHNDSVRAVAFSADGAQLFTANAVQLRSDTFKALKWNRIWQVPRSLPDDPRLVAANVKVVSGWTEDAGSALRPISTVELDAAWQQALRSPESLDRTSERSSGVRTCVARKRSNF